MNQDTRICTFCLCSLLEPMVIPIYIELEDEPKVNDQHIEGICIKSTSFIDLSIETDSGIPIEERMTNRV